MPFFILRAGKLREVKDVPGVHGCRLTELSLTDTEPAPLIKHGPRRAKETSLCGTEQAHVAPYLQQWLWC